MVQHIALVQLVEVLGELAGQQVEGLLVVGDAPLGEGVLVDGLVVGGGELALLGERFPLGLEGTVEVVVVQNHLPGVLLLHGDLEPLALHLHIGGGDFGSGDGVDFGAFRGIRGNRGFHAVHTSSNLSRRAKSNGGASAIRVEVYRRCFCWSVRTAESSGVSGNKVKFITVSSNNILRICGT